MKWMKRMLGVLFSMMILFSAVLPAGAANEETTYTIRIYPGQRGSVVGGGECIEYRSRSYGDWVSFVQNQIKITDTKYYIKGIRESGKDNNTATQNPSFEVTGDRDYVVAYGLLNDAVAYTVNYQNLAGEALAPSETYYGNVGDKPVIAFMYFPNYQPQAYNLARTLSANAAENVFTFVYIPIVSEEIVIPAAPVPAPVIPEPEPPVEPVPVPVGPEPIDIPDEPVPQGPFRPNIGDALEQIFQQLSDMDLPTGDGPGGTQDPQNLVDLDDQNLPQSSFGGDGTFSILNGNAFLVMIPIPVKICILALFVLLIAFGMRKVVRSKAGKKK